MFPCLFDVVLFVLFYRDSNSAHYLIVLISSGYVQIIGVLFATIWRATKDQHSAEDTAVQFSRDLTMQFAANRDVSGGSETQIGPIELAGLKTEISRGNSESKREEF